MTAEILILAYLVRGASIAVRRARAPRQSPRPKSFRASTTVDLVYHSPIVISFPAPTHFCAWPSQELCDEWAAVELICRTREMPI